MSTSARNNEKKPRRVWRRRIIGLVLVIGALLLGAYLFFTSSWYVLRQAQPVLSKALGGPVTAERAKLDPSGKLVLEGVELRAPGLAGEASRVLRIGRLEIDLDRGALWSGSIVPTAITLHDAVVRLSESVESPGSFNYETLAPQSSDSGGDPPRVTVASAKFEVGVHDQGRFELRGELPIVGELYASPGEQDWFQVTLAEAGDGGGAVKDGVRLEGRFRPSTFEYEGRLTGATFTDRIYNLLPTMGRRWWERLDLRGRVANVRLVVNKEHRLWAEVDVEDVAMTIPVQTEGIWARYENGQVSPSQGLPRMHVKSGSIRLEGDELVLDNLVGELSSTVDTPGMPYRVVGRIAALPSFAWNDRETWMRTVVDQAPLDVTFRLENFRYSHETDEEEALELPLAVARVLEKLTVRSALLDTEVHLHRDRPNLDDPDAPLPKLTSNGRVVIRDGSGAFDKFPYPLRDVQGQVSFTMDGLTIESVVGKGSGDSSATLIGTVAPLVNQAAVDLRIEAKNVPVDEALLNAFDEGTRGAFEALFDREATAQLRAVGLLKNPAGRESAIPLEAFEPGGLLNLSLQVTRPFGKGQKTDTTGTINVERADFIYRGFPYPFRVHSGQLLLEPNRIRVVDFEATTAGGGTGTVSGLIGVEMNDGKASVDPDLKIDVVNDRINPLLLAAIPLTSDEQEAMEDSTGWPGRTRSRAATLIEAIDLEGTLSYTGQVRNDDERVLHYDFAVQLKNGVAGRSTVKARQLGVPWPHGFVLENVNGLMRVLPGRIQLASLEGTRGEGTMTASGEILTKDNEGEIEFTADFTDLAVESYLINVFDEGDRADWREWWEVYQPDGRFDLSLHYASPLSRRTTPDLAVQPRGLSVLIGDERLSLTTKEGAIRIENSALLFDGCTLAVGPGGRDGAVMVRGRAGLDGVIATDAYWTNARFEATWLTGLIDRFGGKHAMDWYRAMQPTGVFDATISYGTTDPTRVHPLLVNVQPRTITVQRAGERVTATIAPGGRLAIDPAGVWIHELRGETDDGFAFQFDGTIGQVGEELRAELTIDLDAPSDVRSLHLLLPEDVRESLAAIGFSASRRVKVDDAIFRLRRRADDDTFLTFKGDVALEGAALEAGLRFEEIDGLVHVDAERRGETVPHVTLTFDCDRATVDDRLLRGLHANLVLSEDGDRWLLPRLTASLYDGAVMANAQVGVGESTWYTAQIDVVGVRLAAFTQPDLADSADVQNARGRLYGSLRLRGDRDAPQSREGRGGMRILEGDMANSPLTMSLVQLSQLMLPLHSALDFADASFFVRGDTIVIENLMLESPTLILQGSGTMGFTSGELNFRLRPRGKLGPVSEVLGALNDQLYAIEVRGTLAEPRSSLVPIPGVGQLFDSPHDATSTERIGVAGR